MKSRIKIMMLVSILAVTCNATETQKVDKPVEDTDKASPIRKHLSTQDNTSLSEVADEILATDDFDMFALELNEDTLKVDSEIEKLKQKLKKLEDEGRKVDERGRKADERGRKADERGGKADERGRKADEKGKLIDSILKKS